MKRRTGIRNGVLGAAAIAALFFGGAATAHAQDEKPAEGQQEGIKVHGNWVIEVKNADGTLVQRQEFKNALHSGGAHLGNLLTRNASMGFWAVSLWDPQRSPCVGGTRSPQCEIAEPNTTFTGSNVFKTLSVTGAGPNNSQIVLQGTATALVDGVISQVYSNFGVCGGPTIGGCGSLYAAPFTGHSLSTPIPVVAGQIIQVRVVISFS